MAEDPLPDFLVVHELARPRCEVSVTRRACPLDFAGPRRWQQPAAVLAACAVDAQRVDAQRDDAPMYRGPAAYIHPYYLLDACNKALMRMFILPAWIHTGSEIVIKRPIRVGQEILIRTVPTKKWQRKGHQFIRLAITMSADDEPAIQVQHTAIFRIAA